MPSNCVQRQVKKEHLWLYLCSMDSKEAGHGLVAGPIPGAQAR